MKKILQVVADGQSNKVNNLIDIIDESAHRNGAHVIGDPIYHEKDDITSTCRFLAESHILHKYNNNTGETRVEVYMCGNANPEGCLNYLAKRLNMKVNKIQKIFHEAIEYPSSWKGANYGVNGNIEKLYDMYLCKSDLNDHENLINLLKFQGEIFVQKYPGQGRSIMGMNAYEHILITTYPEIRYAEVELCVKNFEKFYYNITNALNPEALIIHNIQGINWNKDKVILK